VFAGLKVGAQHGAESPLPVTDAQAGVLVGGHAEGGGNIAALAQQGNMQSAFRLGGNLNGTVVLAEQTNRHVPVTVAGIHKNTGLALGIFEGKGAGGEVLRPRLPVFVFSSHKVI